MKTAAYSALAVALVATLGLATPAFAQRATEARAKVAAEASTVAANKAARDAREATKDAKEAAKDAARTGDAVDAHAAHRAAIAAENAKNDAVEASQSAAGAGAQAQAGINKEQGAVEAAVAARATAQARARAENASAAAHRAAMDGTTATPPTAVPVSPNASANARIATSTPGAMAAQQHMSGAGRFHLDTALLDANRDGLLSQAEVAGNLSLASDFARIDVNTDGSLAADELRSWINAGGLAKNARPLGDLLSGTGLSADARFDALDADNDGALTSKEVGVHAGLRSSFRSLDRNRDGRLSSSEFSTWTEARGGTR